MTKHTPGPWKAIMNSSFWEIVPVSRRDKDPYTIGDTCASDPLNRDGGLQEANARLVAAAPDMLSLLNQLVDQDWFEDDASMQLLVAEVIAKAEGKD